VGVFKDLIICSAAKEEFRQIESQKVKQNDLRNFVEQVVGMEIKLKWQSKMEVEMLR